MKKTLIIGASGFGKEVLSLIKGLEGVSVAGYIDQKKKQGELVNGLKVLGNDDDLRRLKDEGVEAAAIAIGDPKIRSKLFKYCKELGYEILNIIHPSAVIMDTVKIGEGVIIYPGVVINAEAVIGNNVLINSGVTIGHETVVEDDVNLNPGVSVGGKALIRKGAYIGIGASIIQEVTVGAGSIIGAGAAVVKDIPENVVAVGVPAKAIKEIK
jgi:sugar O-acyltransferase (sialic acid O-acetyltransferase NeuD family)